MAQHQSQPLAEHSQSSDAQNQPANAQPDNTAPQQRFWRRSINWAFEQFNKFDLKSGRTLLLFWFLMRLLVFMFWALIAPSTQGDVIYYYENVDRLFHGAPPRVVMPEYPTPVIWLLALPWLLGFGTQIGYVVAFVGLILALDAGFAYTLWKNARRLAPHAVAVWTVFIALCGPTVYLRFDLITSVLAGWAIICAQKQRPQFAGALAGVGAAVKLWPALLWPALCAGGKRDKIKTTLGFWSAGCLLALVSLIWGGWDRLISPLFWQSGRGLQVESVWATIPMLLRALGIGDYAVMISRFQAFEVYGTGVDFWINLSDIAFAAGLLIIVAGYAIWLIRGRGCLLESTAFTFLVILTMIVTNKTFSPQYMIWLGGPLGAAFTILGARKRNEPGYGADRNRLWTLTVVILITTGLTAIVYPLGYGPLVRDSVVALWFRIPVTLVLAARNIGIVFAFIIVLGWIWDFLRPSQFRRIRQSGVVLDHIPLRPVR